MSRDEPTNLQKKPEHHDDLLYIYTSGTTGLPKAARITHSRYIYITAAIHYLAAFRTKDIFYTPLPLYHTAGGVMSIGQALLYGSTIVIRKKFSASSYFADCAKYKCTVSLLIFIPASGLVVQDFISTLIVGSLCFFPPLSNLYPSIH